MRSSKRPAFDAAARGMKEAIVKPKSDEASDAAKAVDRRGFLRSIGGASIAGAAVAAGASAPAAARESDSDKRKARYRETDHVKAFYRTNRY